MRALPPAVAALAITVSVMCLHKRGATMVSALQTPRALRPPTLRAGRPSVTIIAMSSRDGWDERRFDDREFDDYPGPYDDNSVPPSSSPRRPPSQSSSFGDYYSAPSNTRPPYGWDGDEQRAYRESKFTREARWPQQQYDRRTFQRSRMDRGLEGPDPFGGGGGRNNYYEGSVRGGSRFMSERGRVREIGRGMSAEDFRKTQRDTRRGSNVGEEYTPNFRRGTKGGRYGDNYREGFEGDRWREGYEERRMPPPPPDRWGEAYRQSNRSDRYRGPESANYRYYDEQRPRPQRGRNEGPNSPESAGYRYYDEQWPRTQRGRNVGPNLANLARRRPSDTFDRHDRPFVGAQSDEEYDFREGRQRPRYTDDFREGRQLEPSLGRGRMDDDMKDEPMGFGYRSLKRAVDRLMNPYSSFSGTDRMREKATMMKDVNVDVDRSMKREQRSTKALLRDARDFLLGDPAVRSMLGDNIAVGAPFARSQSSSTINGVSRMRLQMECPASGSVGTGRIRLVANDDEITFLEVDAGGRVVEVPLDRRRPPPIDANVVDRDIY